MTISSSLNAGVSGLAANASRLGTISDNIANSGTNGYKRAESAFHAMVNGNSPTTYAAGGVRTSTMRDISQQGTLSGTENPTDLAIRGRGFLPVTPETGLGNGNPQMQLSTTGSFRADENGLLKTSQGQVLMGWPADANGNIPVTARDTTAGLRPVVIDSTAYAATPTDQVTLGVNLPADDTGLATPPAPRQISVEYFDNLGSSQSLQFEFAPQANPNEWVLNVTDSNSPAAANPVGTYQLVFDDTAANGGQLVSIDGAAPAALNVPVNGGQDAIEVDMVGNLSQLGDEFAPTSITKNGSPVSTMVSVEVDKSGFVTALYDSGMTKTLYQVPVVDVRNPNGLTAIDGGAYLPSTESGAFYLWDAGSGPTGNVEAYALEQSTVDVAGELTSLIETQRAYSSNAKVIQTVDEMLQETTNIKR